MKIISMYLPQFHQVPENDKWWGKGFTEWSAVKSAERYYDGQYQPKVPLNHNYYNLLDKQTMEWQADLMHKYGIYGMAFYHYWFKNGRKILEKPAENLLRWEDINMPFCFSWANESWTRTWSHLSNKNSWSSKFEPEEEIDESDGILLEQKYGEETDWAEHFNYLRDFFQDERYIKIDGKPIFIIYKPLMIPCIARMVEYWRKLAKQAGFPDIYIIGANVNRKGILDATLLQEPHSSLRNFAGQQVIDGNKLWEKTLSLEVPNNGRNYLCGFPGYDDTPRRGKGGKVVVGISPDDFRINMTKLLAKSRDCGNEFTFINAWNEWGEGMYLEPDEKNGYKMLEAVKRALEDYNDIEVSVVPNQIKDSNHVIDRYHGYWQLLDRWLRLLENGLTVDSYFIENNYKQIAIYGLGMLGQHLVRQLENSEIEIAYGIDQKGNEVKQKFPVLKKEDNLPEVDVIIVSVTYDFSDINLYLREKVKCPIISLEEIIREN